MRSCHTRLTIRVYEDHPLSERLSHHPRGGQLLLDYATAWHGYSLGKEEEQAPTKNAQKPNVQQSQEEELPDGFVDDALS